MSAPDDQTRARVTIIDVAREAGVSVPTVSKVLRNAYGVSPTTRERVEKTIEELDYRPLASARGMRGSTYTIGVLAPDISNPFGVMLIDGVIEGLHSSEYELSIAAPRANPVDHGRAINAMLDRRVDGLVLIAPLVGQDDLEKLGRMTPTVVVGRHGPAAHFDTVAGDDVAGADLVVDHLVSLGHTDIAFVGHGGDAGPRQPHHVREVGFLSAMRRHGLESGARMLRTTWTERGGREAARLLREEPGSTTAVFTGADVVAYGMLHDLWDDAIEIPGHLSIAGYDNTPVGGLAPISLTTVDQGGREMGMMAAEFILERFAGPRAASHRVTAPRLIVRRTTGPR